MATEKPSYYAVIPADVRYNTDIPPNAKLLYGEISALANASGVCHARDSYFSTLYGLAERTIRSLIQALEKAGYIITTVVRDPDSGQVSGRDIFLATVPRKFSSAGENDFSLASGKNLPEASGKNLPAYIMMNNNISPLKPPQGGDPPPKPPRRSRDYKASPDVLPERFSGFWEFYRTHIPKGSNAGNRQKAIRAWDKLSPDDALATTMAKALASQVQTANWKSGIGVPHASTWLNNHGWEDDWGARASESDALTPDDAEAAEWA